MAIIVQLQPEALAAALVLKQKALLVVGAKSACYGTGTKLKS